MEHKSQVRDAAQLLMEMQIEGHGASGQDQFLDIIDGIDPFIIVVR